MSTVKSFLKESLARLTGNTSEVIAQKNYRKATSSVDSQLAALNAKQVDDETNIENALESLNNAKYPTEVITDNKYYLDNIKQSYDYWAKATNILNNTKASIKFFTELKAEFNAEVTPAVATA